MKLEAAMKLLAECALENTREDHLAIYDSIHCVADAAKCREISKEASVAAAAIRKADRAQLRFLDFLAPPPEKPRKHHSRAGGGDGADGHDGKGRRP